MNTGRATRKRIEWTTEGLNVFGPIYSDIKEARIIKRERRTIFANGTEKDIQKMLDFMKDKLGTDR
jgi:hypothetical protein